MPLTLLYRNYGSSNAGNIVVIKDVLTGAPARVYATASGGVLSLDGSYKLPVTGIMSVYVADRQYSIKLLTPSRTEVSVEHQVDASGSAFSEAEVAQLQSRLTGTFYSGAPSGATSVTGTTLETVLASIVIPGGAIGPRGSLRVHVLASVNNDASAKTLKVKLGNTMFASSSITGVASCACWVHIYARGTQNSQVCHPSVISSLTSSGAAVVVGTEDLSTDKLLTLTGTLADVADVITLEAWSVEILSAV